MSEDIFNLLYKNKLTHKLNSKRLSMQTEASFKLSMDLGGLDYAYIATRTSNGNGTITLKIIDSEGNVLRNVETDQVAHNGYTALRFAPLINDIETKNGTLLTFEIECSDECALLLDNKTNRQNKDESLSNTIPGLKLYKSRLPLGDEYTCWLANNMPSLNELNQQRNHKFEFEPLISIVTPLYNTPERYLRDFLKSVISQTYENWELCLADGSDQTTNILKIISEYNEPRIKYKKLEHNGGISINTNAAIEMAKGEYIAFMDHDDTLAPHALYANVNMINENTDYELLYSDEDKLSEDGRELSNPFFKPDFSPHLLLSHNYITHFLVVKRSVLDSTGYFDSNYDGAQDYDLVLKISEKAKKIAHISDILYHWRISINSTSAGMGAKPYTIEAGRRALGDALKRRGIKGNAYNIHIPNLYRINYFIPDPKPLISIIILNKDERKVLKSCVDSIIKKTDWPNYEILIVENNSTDKKLFDYYDELSEQNNIRVIKWEDSFNYSAINNFGTKYANGDLFLFMNNDMTIINDDWLTQMAMYALQPEVGAVGANLLYPDNKLQHAGVVIKIGKVAGHPCVGMSNDLCKSALRFAIVRDVSAVTGACLMVKRGVFKKIKGFDENLAVAFNDVDLCLKIRELGYYIVYTPFAQLYHYESKTRGYEDTPEKVRRFESEQEIFLNKWEKKYPYDPFYSRNYVMDLPGYEVISEKAPPQHNFDQIYPALFTERQA